MPSEIESIALPFAGGRRPMTHKPPGSSAEDKPQSPPPAGGPAEVRRLVLASEPVSPDKREPGAASDAKSKSRKRRRNEPRFRVVADGVEKRVEREDKETGETVNEWRWVCSPVRVLAQTRDPGGENWGKLLESATRTAK